MGPHTIWGIHMHLPLLLVLLVALVPVTATADTRAEIRNVILEGLSYTNKHGTGVPGTIADEGSVEFWSSGGLMQMVTNTNSDEQFEYFNGSAKHIEVIVLVEDEAAVAQYYQEASMKPVGSAPVPNYRTRVTEVFIKSEGRWRRRAAHYSPLVGGSGTSQTQTQ